MRFRIICGFVLLLAHAASGAQETVPEREMTFSGKQDGSVFADFMLEEGEAVLIQLKANAGRDVATSCAGAPKITGSSISGRTAPAIASVNS